MLYSKTDDKRYTMMCKEFDEEFPKPDRDDNKLYRTMYLVFYMLACKENFFQNNFKYYDDYAWRVLSQYQKVSLDFIEKHAKKISWFWLWHNNNIAVPKDFIHKMKEKGIDVGPYYKNY